MHILNNVFIMSDTSRVFAKFHDFFSPHNEGGGRGKKLDNRFFKFFIETEFFLQVCSEQKVF